MHAVEKQKDKWQRATMIRFDGRAWDELRPVDVTTHFLSQAEGSALIRVGRTVVLCAASVEEGVPRFLENSGSGWVTAEYAMLPRSTSTRTPRESSTGRLSGRTQEIQRLIGRSMRAAVDLRALGPHTVRIDCDVLQADGGTRTASITGAYIALCLAVQWMQKQNMINETPLRDQIAAVSVGRVGDTMLIDLPYEEDSQADVDMNVVMTGEGRLIEVQGTAERQSFSIEELHAMLELAHKGIRELIAVQQKALQSVNSM